MTEESHSSSQDKIEITATTYNESEMTVVGELKAKYAKFNAPVQFVLENPQLLEQLEQSGKAESVGILKVGDPPKSTAHWQGRVKEIEQLHQWLANKNIKLIGIEGIGGTGKSMLAAKIYEEIEGFPKRYWADVSSGAIIFSDLARKVLAKFEFPVPKEEKELVNALVRCLRSGQYLLVIDNLESLLKTDRQWKSQFYEEFFRAWIESGKESKIVVTTRERPRLEEFEWLSLKGLKKEEGTALLAELGVRGDLEEFTQSVYGHPLLLTLVAKLLKKEYPQDPSLERLADLGLGNLRQLLTDPKVRGQHHREMVGMALVLDASFRHLKPSQRNLLLKVSVYRRTFDGEAAAMLLESPSLVSSIMSFLLQKRVRAGTVEQELRKLVERSWLEERLNEKRHFEFQPVVGEYVKYKAGDQNGAHRRAIDYYYSIAKEEPWQTKDDLNEYLEIFHHLCQLEEYAEADDILSYCEDFLDRRGYYSTIVELNEQLVQNWQPRNDEEKKNFGWALTRLGVAYYSLGQFQKAIQYHKKSLNIDRELGNREGQGASLNNLGSAYLSLGEFPTAIDYLQQALEIARSIGDRSGEGKALGNLGGAYYSLGEFHTAIDYHQQALDIARSIGDRSGEGRALGNLGSAYRSLGEFHTAIDYHQQALDITREIGDRSGEGGCLGNLGLAYGSLGEFHTAIDYHQQHLDIAREIGDRQFL